MNDALSAIGVSRTASLAEMVVQQSHSVVQQGSSPSEGVETSGMESGPIEEKRPKFEVPEPDTVVAPADSPSPELDVDGISRPGAAGGKQRSSEDEPEIGPQSAEEFSAESPALTVESLVAAMEATRIAEKTSATVPEAPEAEFTTSEGTGDETTVQNPATGQVPETAAPADGGNTQTEAKPLETPPSVIPVESDKTPAPVPMTQEAELGEEELSQQQNNPKNGASEALGGEVSPDKASTAPTDAAAQSKEPAPVQNPVQQAPEKPQTPVSSQNQRFEQPSEAAESDQEESAEAVASVEQAAKSLKETSGASSESSSVTQRSLTAEAAQGIAQPETESGESELGSKTSEQSSEQMVDVSSAVQNTGESAAKPSIVTQNTSNPSPSDTTQDAAGQIRESIQSSIADGKSEITIRLNPPELGRVTVRFEENAGEITASLEVSKAQTRSEIQQALPEMLRNLQEAGVQIRKIDLAAPPEQQHSYRDQQSSQAQAQQDFSQRQQAQQEDSSGGRSSGSTSSGLRAYGSLGRGNTQSIAYTGDNSINMLI